MEEKKENMCTVHASFTHHMGPHVPCARTVTTHKRFFALNCPLGRELTSGCQLIFVVFMAQLVQLKN